MQRHCAGRAMLRHCATLEFGPCSIASSTRHTSRTLFPDCNPSCFTVSFRLYGLEDCGELVALATPEQLTRVFDLDLWRSARAGRDEQFDPDRFGLWLEVLAESGVSLAAQRTGWNGS